MSFTRQSTLVETEQGGGEWEKVLQRNLNGEEAHNTFLLHFGYEHSESLVFLSESDSILRKKQITEQSYL